MTAVARRWTANPTPGAPPITAEGRAMGSPLRLTLGRAQTPGGERADARLARRAWATVVDEFEAAEQAMSRFRDDSEITALNRQAGSGIAIAVSGRLRRALVAADRAHRLSDGRFDPRVLVDLDRLGYRGSPLDAPHAGRDARETAAARHRRPSAGPVVIGSGRGRVVIDRPIDLGGIGKGLALRWAAARLAAVGLTDGLLEAGGDLVAIGRARGGGPWRVGIEDPDSGDGPLAVIEATDRAVATSSTRINRWTLDGRTVHHLLDPRTGEPSNRGLAAVTVAGPDPAWAEVWSKVLFLGGLSTIAEEARSRGMAAWWVGEDGSLAMTPAARAMTIWVAAEDG